VRPTGTLHRVRLAVARGAEGAGTADDAPHRAMSGGGAPPLVEVKRRADRIIGARPGWTVSRISGLDALSLKADPGASVNATILSSGAGGMARCIARNDYHVDILWCDKALSLLRVTKRIHAMQGVLSSYQSLIRLVGATIESVSRSASRSCSNASVRDASSTKSSRCRPPKVRVYHGGKSVGRAMIGITGLPIWSAYSASRRNPGRCQSLGRQDDDGRLRFIDR
jgi:hypothetical protein